MATFTEKFKIARWVITTLARLHFYGDPSKKLKIVGVTGTNGKTTTATLLYRITRGLGYKAGLVSTVENIIDGEKLPTTFTTPEPRQLHWLLNKMVKAGCEYVFMEVSSHGMDQNRVAGIRFTGGIFSNLTHDHLDYHKTFENYFQAKKKFFKMLPKDAFALANADDPHGPRMLEDIKARKYLYGFSPDVGRLGSPQTSNVWGAGFKGEIKKLDFTGTVLSFNGQEIQTKLLGKFNSYNLLAVWAACSLLGFDMDKVKKIMENIEPPRGRFQHFTSSSGVLAIVDYAHTPDALEKILGTIKEIKASSGKIISVFGCGGDRDPSKRKVMGKIGAILSDVAIFTSDNPRSEDPDKIIEQMKEDLNNEELKRILTNSNRREAIKEAVQRAGKGDVVLVAGKGHETYQEIKGVKTHFDDMEELKQALA